MVHTTTTTAVEDRIALLTLKSNVSFKQFRNPSISKFVLKVVSISRGFRISSGFRSLANFSYCFRTSVRNFERWTLASFKGQVSLGWSTNLAKAKLATLSFRRLGFCVGGGPIRALRTSSVISLCQGSLIHYMVSAGALNSQETR